MTPVFAVDVFNRRYIIQHKAVPSLRVTSLVQQWSSPKIVLGIREDWPELIPILNKAIQSITAQEHAAIARVWQAGDTVRWKAVSIRDQLNEEEKAWLDQNHTVRVRIVDWPPYQIVKDNGPPQGIVIEYLKLIGERTRIAFKYEVADQPFAEFLESMKQHQGPDMTAVIVPTPDRDQYLSFSETYLSSPYVIFIREQEKPILDISDLTGKTLAVPRGFVVQEQLDRDYPGIRQALFDSDEKALQAVATGKADAYIGNLTVASHIIHTRGFSHLKVAAAGPFGDQALSIGNRKDWPELTSIIDKALASITEEEKTAIRNKFLAIKFEQGIDKVEVLKWFLSVGGVVLGIVIIILFWNRRLSREIIKRKQTEEDLKIYLPGQHVPRAAHPAERHPRLLRGAGQGKKHHLRSTRETIHHQPQRPTLAEHDQRRTGSIQDRSGKNRVAGTSFRSGCLDKGNQRDDSVPRRGKRAFHSSGGRNSKLFVCKGRHGETAPDPRQPARQRSQIHR
jgi:ABC-type amino acid transport substrate-binding protein